LALAFPAPLAALAQRFFAWASGMPGEPLATTSIASTATRNWTSSRTSRHIGTARVKCFAGALD
jgi:hypothetical protein